MTRAPEATRPRDARDAAPARAPSIGLPPREAGPPRAESVEEVERERQEAKQLLAGLDGSVSARQLTSMADIRGYRHYRQRRFRRAQVWFEAAVRTDPSYEYSLYSAARVASLLGQTKRAKGHLDRLRALGTPLARRALEFAEYDPEMRAARR